MIIYAAAGNPPHATITPLDSPRKMTRGLLVSGLSAAAIYHHSCHSGRTVEPMPSKNPIAKAQTSTDLGMINFFPVDKCFISTHNTLHRFSMATERSSIHATLLPSNTMPRLLPSPWEQTIAAVAMQTLTEDPGNQWSKSLHKERMAKDK